MGFPILGALIVADAFLKVLGTHKAGKDAKRKYAAEKAFYEEEKKAKLWREIESLLHGGMGVAGPVQPPFKPRSPGALDYMAQVIPSLGALWSEYGEGLLKGKKPEDLSQFASGKYKSKYPKDQFSRF